MYVYVLLIIVSYLIYSASANNNMLASNYVDSI